MEYDMNHRDNSFLKASSKSSLFHPYPSPRSSSPARSTASQEKVMDISMDWTSNASCSIYSNSSPMRSHLQLNSIKSTQNTAKKDTTFPANVTTYLDSHNASMKLAENHHRSVLAPSQPQPYKYRSVLQLMGDVAKPSDSELSRNIEEVEISGNVRIAPIPNNLEIYFENQRKSAEECRRTEEQAVTEQVQLEVKSEIFQEKRTNFLATATRDLSIMAKVGLPELMRKRRAQIVLARESGKSASVDGATDQTLSVEDQTFCRAMRECNEAVLCGNPIKFADKFTSTAESVNNVKVAQLWKAFRAMTCIETSFQKTPSAKDVLKFRQSVQFQKQVMTRARLHLEQVTFESVIPRNVNPSTLRTVDINQLVLHYVRNQLLKHKSSVPVISGKIQMMPEWAVIYYALRLGCLKSAVEFAEQGETTRQFVKIFEDYERNEGRLSLTGSADMQNIYTRAGFSTVDPYRKTVMDIMRKSQPENDYAELGFTITDYLWIKVVQAEFKPEAPGRSFVLTSIQKLVREKFDTPTTDPLESFLVLLFTGQFELAIERLHHDEKCQIHAVLMAISLNHSELLIRSSCIEPHSDSEVHGLDLVYFIQNFAWKLRKNYPDFALEYFFHLRDFPASGGKVDSMFELCVSELAVTSKCVDIVFGKFEPNSCQVPGQKGLIWKFVRKPESLIVGIAQDLEKVGRLEEAVILYELTGQTEIMLQSLLTLLADVLLLPVDDDNRKRIKALSTDCVRRYKLSETASSRVAKNVFVLLDVMTFFELVDQKQYKAAINHLQQVGVIPLSHDELGPLLENYSQNLCPEMRRCLPEILLTTMRTLVNWYETAKLKLSGHRVSAFDLSATSFYSQQSVDSSLSSNVSLAQLQLVFRSQCGTVLEFVRSIPSPNATDLIHNLIFLEQRIL